MHGKIERALPPPVRLAMDCLATADQSRSSFGGQLAKVVETTINACYREGLLSRLEISNLAELKQELGRNRSNFKRSPRRMSDLEMDLFFPVAVGRLLEPLEFIPRIGPVMAQAALASVTETARLLLPTRFTSKTCAREELLIALFLLECDRAAELLQALDSESWAELRNILTDTLADSGGILSKRIGAAHVTFDQCEVIATRWIAPVAVWYWTMPPAFQDAIDEYVSGEA